MAQSNIKQVNCPTCQTIVAWVDSSKHRPFCSERCKLIDFGDWATEKNAIAAEPTFPYENENSEELQ